MDFLNKHFSSLNNCDNEIKSYTKNIIHPNYFTENEKLNIFEDDQHEFKMMNINNKQDIPEKIRILDKYICAFLNTNSGVIYVGVTDEGIVKGLKVDGKLLDLFKKELQNLSNKYDKQESDKRLVTFYFKNLYTKNYIKNSDSNHDIKTKSFKDCNFYKFKNNNSNCDYTLKVKEDYFVLEIFVQIGVPYNVYFSTLKDQGSEELQCYVKLNGTLKHLEGRELHKYAKRKVKMFCLLLKSEANFIRDNYGMNDENYKPKENQFFKSWKNNRDKINNDSMSVNKIKGFEGTGYASDLKFNLEDTDFNLILKENFILLNSKLQLNSNYCLDDINHIDLDRKQTEEDSIIDKYDNSFSIGKSFLYSENKQNDKFTEKDDYPNIEYGVNSDEKYFKDSKDKNSSDNKCL